jgi:hypothetical protein
MTRDELLKVVYRFYPRGLPCYDPAYAASKERLHLTDAARQAVVDYPTWKAMIRRLGGRYPLQNESLFLLAGGVDPAYSAYIILPECALGFHVCFLGPYYAVHTTGATGEEPAATEIAQEIEATYPGYQPIPLELGNEVVSDVDGPQRLGEATIYDCLFSEVWRRSSFPLPLP